MKRMLCSAVTIVLAMAVSLGDAEAQRRIVPFAGGGLATGMGDLGDGTGNGWVGFAGVDIPLPAVNPGLSFGVTGSYSHVPYTGTFSEATNVSALVGEVGYLINTSSVVKPYLRGGLGAQLRKYDPGNTGFRAQSEGGLALSVGAGVQFLVSSTAIFVGAHIITDADAGVLALHGGIGLPGTSRTAR
jgi:hypothetical protein